MKCIADQLRRSSKAIGANLAEGFAKQSHSKAEFARFVSMAIGSCSEVETWISYALDHAGPARLVAAILCQGARDACEPQREADLNPSASIPQFFSSSIPLFFMFWPHFRLRCARIVALAKWPRTAAWNEILTVFLECRLTQTWLLGDQRNHSNCEGEAAWAVSQHLPETR